MNFYRKFLFRIASFFFGTHFHDVGRQGEFSFETFFRPTRFFFTFFFFAFLFFASGFSFHEFLG